MFSIQKKSSSWDWKSQDWFVSITEIGPDRKNKLLNELVKLKAVDDWNKTVDEPLYCKITFSTAKLHSNSYGHYDPYDPKNYLSNIKSKIKIEGDGKNYEFVCHFFSNRHFLSKLVAKEWFAGLVEIDDPEKITPSIVPTSHAYIINIKVGIFVNIPESFSAKGLYIVHTGEVNEHGHRKFICKSDRLLSQSDQSNLLAQPWCLDIKHC